MPHYQYSAGDHPDYHYESGRYDFPDNQKLYGEHWDLVASDLAGDFHDNHDGWESSWPLDMRIYKDGSEVGRFSVELDMSPTFHAEEVEIPEGVA